MRDQEGTVIIIRIRQYQQMGMPVSYTHLKLPHFEVPEGYDSWTYLNKLCHEGLVKRYPDRHEELLPKLEDVYKRQVFYLCSADIECKQSAENGEY